MIFTKTLVRIPKINAAATSVIVTSPFNPKLMDIPPTPQIKMTETTNKFLLSPRSTSLIIFKPETAMKPYKAIQTPPMTQLGIVLSKSENGKMKDNTMAMQAVTKIVLTEALPEMATQPMDSP